MSNATQKLFDSGLKVINIGLDHFGEKLRDQGVEVEQVEWRPPAGGDRELAAILEQTGY